MEPSTNDHYYRQSSQPRERQYSAPHAQHGEWNNRPPEPANNEVMRALQMMSDKINDISAAQRHYDNQPPQYVQQNQQQLQQPQQQPEVSAETKELYAIIESKEKMIAELQAEMKAMRAQLTRLTNLLETRLNPDKVMENEESKEPTDPRLNNADRPPPARDDEQNDARMRSTSRSGRGRSNSRRSGNSRMSRGSLVIGEKGKKKPTKRQKKKWKDLSKKDKDQIVYTRIHRQQKATVNFAKRQAELKAQRRPYNEVIQMPQTAERETILNTFYRKTEANTAFVRNICKTCTSKEELEKPMEERHTNNSCPVTGTAYIVRKKIYRDGEPPKPAVLL